jgi:hypothetical protein
MAAVGTFETHRPHRAMSAFKGNPQLRHQAWSHRAGHLPEDRQGLGCESARGSDADRHTNLLIYLAVEGSTLNAYSHSCFTPKFRKLVPNEMGTLIGVETGFAIAT